MLFFLVFSPLESWELSPFDSSSPYLLSLSYLFPRGFYFVPKISVLRNNRHREVENTQLPLQDAVASVCNRVHAQHIRRGFCFRFSPPELPVFARALTHWHEPPKQLTVPYSIRNSAGLQTRNPPFRQAGSAALLQEPSWRDGECPQPGAVMGLCF